MSLPDLETDPAVEFCGTERGYQRHRRAGVDSCQPCRDAHARYERVRTKGTPEKRRLQPCGTDAAYYRHRRRGEPRDAACLAAHARAEGLRQLRVQSTPKEEAA